jgi:hypothetical protein
MPTKLSDKPLTTFIINFTFCEVRTASYIFYVKYKLEPTLKIIQLAIALLITHLERKKEILSVNA